MPTTLEKRRSYRRRTSRSLCRKKTGKKCLRLKGCKPTRKTMKRKSYCRKSKKHVVKGGAEGTKYYEQSVIKYLENRISNIRSFLFGPKLKLYKPGGPYTLTITKVETKDDDDYGNVVWFYCGYVDKDNANRDVIIKLVHNRVKPGDQMHAEETLGSYYVVGNVNDKNVFEGTVNMQVKTGMLG